MGIYGWLALAFVFVGFAVWLRWAIRKGAHAEAIAERETQARFDAERKAKEHETVADVERRDLPRGVAGRRVRDVHKPIGE